MRITITEGETDIKKLAALLLALVMLLALAGCGKSAAPADGKARPLEACRIGYLPQKSYAFRMSVARNIALNGSDEAKRARLTAALQLGELSGQRAKKLSGGSRSRGRRRPS